MILQTSLLLFSKELADEEKNFWLMFIDPIPTSALRYAFENWNRNGRFFPKPKDIGDLAEAYTLSKANKFKACGENGCIEGWRRVFEGVTTRGNPVDPIVGAVVPCKCRAGRTMDDSCTPLCEGRHGHGYHTNDLIWLFKRMQREIAGNRPVDYEALLAELDRQRTDGAPAWRR